MIRQWIESSRRRAARRNAAALQDWLTSIETIMEACTSCLRDKGIPSDIGVPLDRVDRELMRFRNHAAEVGHPLRRHSLTLAARVAQATDRTFLLRNLTCAFLLRWRTAQQTDPGTDHALMARREMEEARLTAAESAHALRAEMRSLVPELRRTIALWMGTD